jgi:hypothetical protein
VSVQELVALHKPLLMGVDRFDVLQLHPRKGGQTVLHLHLPLPHQGEIILGQQVVDLPDGPGGGVLNGEHGVVGLPPAEGGEHVVEPGKPLRLHTLSEEPGGRLLRIAPRLSLVDHTGVIHRGAPVLQGLEPPGVAPVLAPLPHQLALLAAGDGHNGLVEGGQVGLGGGVVGEGGLGGNDLLLPLGVQHRDTLGLFIFPHPPGHFHPLQKEPGKLGVDGVDLGTVFL